MADQGADVLPARRSALEGVLQPGPFGAGDFRGPGLALRERHPLSLVEIEATSRSGAAQLCEQTSGILGVSPSERANVATGSGRPRIIWTGRWRWLVVEPEWRDLSAALAPTAGIRRDLSHGRTVLRISGRRVRQVLMKGAPIDWHPGAFGPGACAQTLMFHHSVLVDCRETDRFDLFVARGFARDFLERLIDAGAEYGWSLS